MSEATNNSFDKKSFLASLTSRPGVYRMHAEDDTIIYVGKARNLKKTRLKLFSCQWAGTQDSGAHGTDA